MRVLHIGKFFPPHPGGIERTCAELSCELATDGVATAVLAHAEPGTWRSRRFRHGDVDITLVACPGQWLYAPVSPGFGWRLSRLIAEFKPELLHLHLPNTSAFWALLLPAARRLPWIVHWHADIPLDSQRKGLRLAYRLYRPWEQAVLRRARAVIASSAPYLDSSPA
ncbi:MAG: glycosyltransferase, partial [Rudaea sp.]